MPTTRSVHDLARQRGVEMPITDELYRILFEGKSPHEAVTDLMIREPKVEGAMRPVDSWPSECGVAFREWAGVCESCSRRAASR